MQIIQIFRKIEYFWAKIFKKIRGAAIAGTFIHPSSKVESGSSLIATTMDRHSFCGYDCQISNCEIGPFCSIADYVAIGGGQHPTEWVGTSPVFYEGRDSVKKKLSTHRRPAPKKVQIGADVWVGFRAVIMQGVTIGPGAVIGAGSVVTRDVPAYAIVAGTPARVIRYRFDENLRSKLLSTSWWNLDDRELEKFSDFFNNPEAFIEEFYK